MSAHQANHPIALSAIRKRVNTAALKFAQARQEVEGMPTATIEKIFAHETFEWHDTDSFVWSYHNLVDVSGSPAVYTRRVDLQPPHVSFPLSEWWDLHRSFCKVCQAHHEAHDGYKGAMEHNTENMCSFADILSWLSGQWRIPLESIPPPGERNNYESLWYDPATVKAEIERMKEWAVLVPGRPHLIHPLMGVVRDSDLYDACRILQAIGHPSPSEDKKDVAAINAHISEVLASGVTIPPHFGVLKPLKVRICIDASYLLNKYIKKWRFPYASIHDSIILLRHKWFISRIDLKRFFQQLPLSEEDWPMLGVRLPKDLHALCEEVETWVSAFAHFGGSPFPAYANAVMSAVSAILRAHGVPNVFITDDVFICAATYDDCMVLLDKAVQILTRLGWKLQDDKIIPPAQQVPFVGILIDSVNQRLSIPQEKLDNYRRTIDRLLADDSSGTLLAKELESLVGKLSWVTEVMIAGKAHIWPLRQSLPHGWYHRRNVHATVRLGSEARSALEWWAGYIEKALQHPFWVPFWTHATPLHCRTFSDSSGDIGFGLTLEETVYQGLWAPETVQESSGFKELIPILLAVHQLGESARGKIVVVTTDNLGNVIAINKGSCRSARSYKLLALIMELAAEKQIYLVADWSPREQIDCIDEISREPWEDETAQVLL